MSCFYYSPCYYVRSVVRERARTIYYNQETADLLLEKTISIRIDGTIIVLMVFALVLMVLVLACI